jgi:hypothetical protein
MLIILINERERERERAIIYRIMVVKEYVVLLFFPGERVCSASVFKFPWLTLTVD